ncbi:helix-turn-helix DNA binding protein [Gordonia phage Patio]|uniref:Helix-turn-helix DNA binding protein n=2 Tax=Skysandvirus TaxID=2948912 RepID=A0A2D2W4N0_9CAUD|nr:helix-turn-helix DNA binding protein [Gordonia phage Patio]YP_010098127.1 helix-turn-helix DNA binding protein [Gordonia phage Skysand]QRI45298.1 helix-turn-helix DNA binding domain protein [Gordonia phage Ennea]QXN74441.1 helix-turn-helix DNA binding domain protein [Gordonia phage Float294]ATS93141.1 helix-turn-helix DNA binding protein [Gordonia phage Patio]AXQ62092.1 helix-turn-helix DNA binding protein [Gordonia phage Skysand]
MARGKSRGVLISLEQAAEVIGVHDYTLRRAVIEGMKSLKIAQTSGNHRRVYLDQILDNHDQIVAELARRRENTRWEDKPIEIDPEKSAKLREVLRETVDANTAAMELGVSRPTLRRWERESKIIGTRPLGPKQVRYYRESIAALLDNQAVGA